MSIAVTPESSWESELNLTKLGQVRVGINDHRDKTEILANNAVPLLYGIERLPERVNLLCYGAYCTDLQHPTQSDEVLAIRMAETQILGSHLLSYDENTPFESKLWDKCPCGANQLNMIHFNAQTETELARTIFGTFIDQGPFVVSLFNGRYGTPGPIAIPEDADQAEMEAPYREGQDKFFKTLKLIVSAGNFRGLVVGYTQADSPMMLYGKP